MNINKLILENVTFRYNDGARDILESFSMVIPKPSVTTLLGLNGSGKTTLLLLLLGYYKADEGQIFVEDDRGRRPINELEGLIGYLPQRENIPFDYSVREFILLGRNSHIGLFGMPGKDDKKKVMEAMNFLEINDLAERGLSSISGGELQRVRIARLLVQDPAVILLDEPSSHLDIKSKKQIIELIGSLRDLGKIVIYSTHDPLDALNYSDHSIMMKKGMAIISGESKTIVNKISLSSYFDTKMEICEMNGQKIVLVKNGYKKE